mmetsp:Transcript_4317/g.11157  ORF Transcript_4317/g.11157 Transcript_4317/m.11157 type:complete len:80 (+) Transcript_4317:1717-1956(+)
MASQILVSLLTYAREISKRVWQTSMLLGDQKATTSMIFLKMFGTGMPNNLHVDYSEERFVHQKILNYLFFNIASCSATA